MGFADCFATLICGVGAPGVRAKARIYPHVTWSHVGAFWPVVPASDDVIQSETVS